MHTVTLAQAGQQVAVTEERLGHVNIDIVMTIKPNNNPDQIAALLSFNVKNVVGNLLAAIEAKLN